MSSLAAAKADNFYFPEDFDPSTHRTLNRYHGQHALRERALPDGALVVRFEVPFSLACGRCGEAIAKGVRFNAAKRRAGNYHSTAIWSFTMSHHCGSVIVVQTDPARADYAVVSGARRRAAPGEGGGGGQGEGDDDDGRGAGGGGAASAAEARLLRLEEELLGAGPSDAVPRDHVVGRAPPSAAAAAAAAAGPMAALERGHMAERRAAERRSRLEALEDSSAARHASGRGLALNRALRDRMRAVRGEEWALEGARRRMGVSASVRLLPLTAADGAAAAEALAAARQRLRAGGAGGGVEEEEEEARRRRILSQPIFARAGAAAGGGSVAAALEAARASKRSREANAREAPPRPRRPAAAAAAAVPALAAGVAAWAPPLARRRR